MNCYFLCRHREPARARRSVFLTITAGVRPGTLAVLSIVDKLRFARNGRLLGGFVLALCLLVPSAALARLPVEGNAEYLFSTFSRQDTPINPGNALSVPGYSHLFELRLNSSFRRFYGEWRGRYESYPEKFSSHLDQAYLTFEEHELVKFKIGRQRVGFGVGYVWNPVNDLDKRRDIYNPQKYVEGVNALKTTFDFAPRFGKPLTLSVEAVLPDSLSSAGELQYTKLGSQFYVLTRDIELGLAASFSKNKDADNDILFGAYSSMDIGGMILGLEYAVTRKPFFPYFSREGMFFKNDLNHQALVNLNRRLTEKSFLMLEYFYNGFGYTDREFDDLLALLDSSYATYGPLAVGSLNPGYVSKDYFFGTVSQEVSDYWALALTAMVNLDRPGAFLYPQLTYTGINDVTLFLEGITNFYGTEPNEFSLNIYRHALLLRAQYFF